MKIALKSVLKNVWNNYSYKILCSMKALLLNTGIFTAGIFTIGVFASDIFIQSKLLSGVFTAGGITEWSVMDRQLSIVFKTQLHYYY